LIKILIVEDEEPVRRLVKEILERKGYTCTQAANALEAREHLNDQNFELALCDIKLPGESGLSLIKDILAGSPDTAVVMVTGINDPLVAEAALETGVYSYIIKPFDRNGLLISVANALHRRELEIANRAYREELEQMVAKLQREIIERKRVEEELHISKEAAEVANRAKSSFLASMSHELRTPLNSIIGFSEVLQDKYFGELNEKQAEYVNDILESGKHLLSLINDILDLSKVEAGKIELKLSKVTIKQLLRNSLTMVKEKCMHHGISLSLNIAQGLEVSEITADERRLKQIIFNLLSNAAKFTPDGGAIMLEAEQNGEELIVSVRDTGIGIASEDQDKIFEEFYQTSGTLADKTPGTGLGLPLTKDLVEMHGGRIWVESRGVGKGARFRFALPVKPVDLEPPVAMITSKTTLLNRLERKIRLSKRHDSIFSLSCLHGDSDLLREKMSIVKEALEEEIRDQGFLGIDNAGYVYLIFQETSPEKANATCSRLKNKIEGMIEGMKVSYSIAAFPQNGNTAKVIMKK
jgi:signal transduction histidine kinase